MSSVSALPEEIRPPPKGRRRFTVDALFTDHRPQAVGVEDLPTAKEIRLERIEADPEQPRRTFDPDRLDELTASIHREGVLQPIAVSYDAERDVYVVVHGERRLRAARAAGLAAIPAIVRDVPHDRRLVQQLMENIVRDDLNPVDRAAALRALKTQLGDAPWETVAEMVGIRRSRLFQLLGTEKLPLGVRDDIRSGRISEKQSRALQGLPASQQEALRDAILAYDLPAETATRIARALKHADLEDDVTAAAAFIAALRDESADAPNGGDPLSQAAGLLAAIEAAVAGDRGSAEALAAAAKTARARAFDGDRLRDEVLALARTLSRTPSDELVPGGAAYMPLSMLRGTLDSLLPAD
ncbi:MAG: ParB/RepB/Spo0J family partition protein [Chloroflexia bacterium]|nr:ParB/RepB/Spo0J family partition protein [Chloroflexia bacterium]